MNQQQLNWIALSGQLLGTAFYCEPHSEHMQPILSFFQQDNWQDEWQYFSEKAQLAALFQFEFDLHILSEEYQALFIGPYHLEAPPWGSVYLDPEQVIFGSSLIELETFLTRHQIVFAFNDREPADHIGLMLCLVAYLAKNRMELVSELLQKHLYPWVFQYLERLKKQPVSQFYADLAILTEATIKTWKIR